LLFFFQAEDGIRDLVRSRGLGDVYKRQEVKLKQVQNAKTDKYTAEVIIFVEGHTFIAKESTMNMYAAIDIIELKLQKQLKKHKQKTAPDGLRHHARRVKRKVRKFLS